MAEENSNQTDNSATQNAADPPASANTPSPTPAQTSTPTPTPPPANEESWQTKRIAELTGRLHQAREERDAALAKANGQGQSATPTTPATPTPPAFDQVEFDRRVDARAAEKAAITQFNDQCNTCVTAGRKEFGVEDFDARVQSLRKLVDDRDPVSSAAYNQLLLAAFETGDAPRLIHELGGNLNEAQRLLSLTPVKMAVELTRMAKTREDEESPRGTNRMTENPRPVTPVGSRGSQHTSIAPDDPDRADTLNDAEWMRRRNEQIEARYSNGRTARR